MYDLHANSQAGLTAPTLQVVHILEKVFSKPGKIKYGNIHLLAILLSALYRYHPSFVIRVVNLVLESISFGLEQNDFKFYQRRIADVRFLGELYNYRMLEHPVIFDTMYRILTFGHGKLSFPLRVFTWTGSLARPCLIISGLWQHIDILRLGGVPITGKVNPYDLPGDFFRIRLITTLLETCGMFFNRGAAGKRLDVFLSLFQVRV